MQQLKKTAILSAAPGGALVGVLATPPSFHFLAGVPAFELDHAFKSSWQFVAACIGWVLFSVYWEIASRNASAAATSESKASRGVHVFLTNAALLVEIVPLRGLGRIMPMASLIMTAGVAIEALGLFLAIWARRHLGKHWSGEITIKVGHELIRSGPYSRLRHPIYSGLLAMYAGTAVVAGTWLAVIGVALAAFAYWRKICLEEANLSVAFGPVFDDYRRDTGALVPGVF